MSGTDEVQRFVRNETVLCYEPDPSKAKVLYDSKVLGVYECHDKNGLRYYEYKVHFHGWKRTWDRKVRTEFLLKDNEENRKLQRELAEQAQLTIGGYSYKDRGGTGNTGKRKLEKRPIKRTAAAVETVVDELVDGTTTTVVSSAAPPTSSPRKKPVASRLRDTNSHNKPERVASTSAFKSKAKYTDDYMEKQYQHQHTLEQTGERVMLRLGEQLRLYLEYDYEMVVRHNKQHSLPARKSIVDILEDFVKQRSVELALTVQCSSSRTRNTQQHAKHMERECLRVMSTVNLLKEVVDGLRIYFEFLLCECLLYKEERAHVQRYLDSDYLTNFKRKTTDVFVAGGVNSGDMDLHTPNGDILTFGSDAYKEQLRHYLTIIENENCTHTSSYAAAAALNKELHKYLEEVFAWRILPNEADSEKSMIFGAPHLARLMIKLPEYLSASSIRDDKLKILLKHLDSFINYLESHREWFGEDNYARFYSKRTCTERSSDMDSQPQKSLMQQELLETLELTEVHPVKVKAGAR